jgi:hypothetical protein
MAAWIEAGEPIAKLVAVRKESPIAIVMFILGGLAMLTALFDSSAIRLAAWGAIWTGWNVLWAAVAICSAMRGDYTVHRPKERE